MNPQPSADKMQAITSYVAGKLNGTIDTQPSTQSGTGVKKVEDGRRDSPVRISSVAIVSEPEASHVTSAQGASVSAAHRGDDEGRETIAPSDRRYKRPCLPQANKEPTPGPSSVHTKRKD